MEPKYFLVLLSMFAYAVYVSAIFKILFQTYSF